jgi:tetratricopeptide (TPR) repeat protein
VWDAPWYWGYWPYYNPYSTEVVVVERTVIDYSQPIVVAAPAAPAIPASGAESTDPASLDKESVRLLDASRDAFVKADYQAAMALINQAIARKPNDPVLHEVRSLVLFARGQYSPAAAAIFAVLSVGPGWDAATLSGFYPNPAVYSDQMRALEQHCSGHADQAEVHFLLAYHYMVGGRIEAAAAEFQEAMRLNPKDQLSPQLLAGLSKQASGGDTAAVQASAPSPPVDRAALVGAWTASRSDGAAIALDISEDATFCWKYTQQGKLQQEFRGTYTVAENLLILKCSGNPTLIGQVSAMDGGRFNFKLVGSNASDPGLTFAARDAEHTAQNPQAPQPEVRR